MARTEEGTLLTQRFRREQLGLRNRMGADLSEAWKVFDPSSIASYSDFVTIATAVINQRHGESSDLGTAYYNLFRQAEGVGGAISVVGAMPLDGDSIIDNLRATGLATALSALYSGESIGAASAKGLIATIGAATRLTLMGGRDAVILTMGNDALTTRWARVTSGSPCSFCAMLASRGPSFASEDTASFRSHSHCVCQPEPHYEGSHWPGNARNYRSMWEAAAKKAAETGEDPAVVFRRRIEGREDPKPATEE